MVEARNYCCRGLRGGMELGRDGLLSRGRRNVRAGRRTGRKWAASWLSVPHHGASSPSVAHHCVFGGLTEVHVAAAAVTICDSEPSQPRKARGGLRSVASQLYAHHHGSSCPIGSHHVRLTMPHHHYGQGVPRFGCKDVSVPRRILMSLKGTATDTSALLRCGSLVAALGEERGTSLLSLGGRAGAILVPGPSPLPCPHRSAQARSHCGGT